MPLKVGLLGFGRTGIVVAKELALDSDVHLEWVLKRTLVPESKYASRLLGFNKDFAQIYSSNNLDLLLSEAPPVDMVIDFSSGQNIDSYSHFAERGIKIVSAISNYTDDELKIIKKISQKTSILHSPNITLGINWLIVVSKILKKIIPHADIEVIEQHFKHKSDVSGTALRLAKHLDLDPKDHVNSIRVGGIVGKHEVIFGLPHQTLRLIHESISRSAFGTGAIFAAQWLKSKPHGLYSMEDALRELFTHHMQQNFL